MSEENMNILHSCYSHRYNLVAELDPDNTGVLIVYLGGQGRSSERAIGPNEIVRGLEDKDTGCVIM